MLKKEISFSCYQECGKKEYKQYKILQIKTEYKYRPKKGKCNRYYNDISIMPSIAHYILINLLLFSLKIMILLYIKEQKKF